MVMLMMMLMAMGRLPRSTLQSGRSQDWSEDLTSNSLHTEKSFFFEPDGSILEPEGSFLEPEGIFLEARSSFLESEGSFLDPKGSF